MILCIVEFKKKRQDENQRIFVVLSGRLVVTAKYWISTEKARICRLTLTVHSASLRYGRFFPDLESK